MLTNKIFNASTLLETLSRRFPLGSAELLSLVSRSAPAVSKSAEPSDNTL